MDLLTCAGCGALVQSQSRCVICGGTEVATVDPDYAADTWRAMQPKTRRDRQRERQRSGAPPKLRPDHEDRESYAEQKASSRKDGTLLAGVLALLAVGGGAYLVRGDLHSTSELSVPRTVEGADVVIAAEAAGTVVLPEDWANQRDLSGTWDIPMPVGHGPLVGPDGQPFGFVHQDSDARYQVESSPGVDPAFGEDDRTRVSQFTDANVSALLDGALNELAEFEITTSPVEVDGISGLLVDGTGPTAERLWAAILPTRDDIVIVTMATPASASPDVTMAEWLGMIGFVG